MSEPGSRPLLLGLGWPPDTTGGLDRYYRDLFEALRATPGAASDGPGPWPHGVVIGPVAHPPAGLDAVSRHGASLLTRVRAFDRAAVRAAGDADLVDSHFALYAARPVRRPALRRLPQVVHFHGPWSAEADAQASTGRGARTRVSHRVRHGIERSVYRRAHRAITLSGAFARLLVEDFGVSPWRVRIVPPSVDLTRFSPGPRPDARGRVSA